MKRFSQRKWLLLIVLAMMLALPVTLGGHAVLAILLKVKLKFVGIFLLLLVIRWFCMAVRFNLLLDHNGYRRGFFRVLAICLSSIFLAENTVAIVGGGASNLVFLKQVSVPYATTIATCVMLELLDFIAVFLIISTCALTMIHLTSGSLSFALVGLLLMVPLMVTTWVTLYKPAFLNNLANSRSIKKLIPTRYHTKAISACMRLSQVFDKTSRLPPRTFVYILTLSLVFWTIRFSMLYLAILAVGGQIEWPHAAMVQFVSGLTGLLTAMPGGFPGTDISAIALLHGLLGSETALAALLLWRLMTHYTHFITGGAAFLWLSAQRESQQ